jgi:uncharacterized C2H2 Zn-finger protein
LRCGFQFQVEDGLLDDGWIVKREGDKVFIKSGEVMYQCPHCKAQEKPMFFSSEHDLKLHVKAFHGGYPDPDYVR